MVENDLMEDSLYRIVIFMEKEIRSLLNARTNTLSDSPNWYQALRYYRL